MVVAIIGLPHKQPANTYLVYVVRRVKDCVITGAQLQKYRII